MGEPPHFLLKPKILGKIYGVNSCSLIFYSIFTNEPILTSSNHLLFKKNSKNMLQISIGSGTLIKVEIYANFTQIAMT